MAADADISEIAKADLASLCEMMRELADHEGERQRLVVSQERLEETGFGDSPQWAGLMARSGGQPVGYVTYTEDFHIWGGLPRIALDDVYVRPLFRDRGLGEELMRYVFRYAEAKNAIVAWMVETANKRAIAFYERLGAQYDVIGKCRWRLGA